MTHHHFPLFGVAILSALVLLGMQPVAIADNKVPKREPLCVLPIPVGHLAQNTTFLPDGKEVLITAIRQAKIEGEGHLHFFDMKTDKLVRSIERPTRVACCTVFVDGGKKLVAAGWDDKFRVYGGNDWKEIDTFDHLSGDDTSRTLDTDAGGKLLAVANFGKKGPRVWDVTKKEFIRFPGNEYAIQAAALSPDGKELAVAYQAPLVELYEVSTQKLTTTFKLAENHHPRSILYSPDGKKLIAGYCGRNQHDGQLLIWDAAKRDLLHTVSGASFQVNKLAVTPDSKYAITYASPGSLPGRMSNSHVVVWSLETGKLVERFDAGDDGGSRFALSPDGKLLVTVAYDGTARKWDFAAIRKEFEAKMAKEKK